MKVGCLPSSGITRSLRYSTHPSDFSPACLGFRLPLYRAIAAITRDERDLPRYPLQLPPHAIPTTPESPSAFYRLSLQMAAAFPT